MAESAASVLVVDDNPVVRDLVRLALERTRRLVTVAQDGAEAIQRIAETAFDLVITDLSMPRRNGLEVIAMLRERQPHARVIAMSGEWSVGALDYRRVAEALGVRAFLKKPFPLSRMIELVEGEQSVPAPIGEHHGAEPTPA